MHLLLFLFLAAGSSPGILLEAETATLFGVSVSQSGSGYSGTGFVTGFDQDGDRVEFTFEATSGLYEIEIGFATPYGEKGFELTVNGTRSSGMFPDTGGAFSSLTAGKFELNNGSNKIIVAKGWGWYSLDFIRLLPTSVSAPSKPPKRLINSDASAATRSLHSYLVEQFGSKVLSGQQSMADINYVKSVTGKTPAVGSFDLIDYSPSRVEHGAKPGNAVESWISWAEQGKGIISICWHWNAPSGLINTAGKEWWRGFYTEATTFDLAAAMAEPSSPDYQLLLRDMDAIAVQLKKLQAANIPVLWRPLHEASGGWFWWGAKGPEPFKALWRLMVERFTAYHGLHNLIWVYTAGSESWYPGDSYVDIASLDIYTDQSSNMSGEWENIQNSFNGRKLVALSESGTLPVPARVRTFATWWSWFSTWSGDFIRKADQNLLRTVYQDPDVITLENLTDWRRYASTLYFAHFADGYGLSSQIILTNLDPENDAAVYIQPRSDEGSPLPVTFNGSPSVGELEATIPAGGMRVFETPGNGDTLSIGSATVTSTGTISGVLLFAGPGLGLAGVGASEPFTSGFSTPMIRSKAKGIRTGVAVMNLDPLPSTCSFTLLDPEGQVLATSDGSLQKGGGVGAPLPGRGHFSVFADELSWTPSLSMDDIRGTLEVACSARGSATAIQMRPGQFATLPVSVR